MERQLSGYGPTALHGSSGGADLAAEVGLAGAIVGTILVGRILERAIMPPDHRITTVAPLHFYILNALANEILRPCYITISHSGVQLLGGTPAAMALSEISAWRASLERLVGKK